MTEALQSPVMVSRDRRSVALGNLRVLSDELLCGILGSLSCRDVGCVACVSSVMYILCNEEPLWMTLCFNSVKGQLQYKGSWKKTALSLEHLLDEYGELCHKPLQFDGFNSLFLYRRLYRCYTTLDCFSFDSGNVERKNHLSLEEFNHQFDGKKPVLVSGLADTWPARNTWTIDQLLSKYGDATFKISQRSAQKITMKFSDYVSYMKAQHDEDPLYIFDEKIGETAPDLLNDYNVPSFFQEDLFDVLDGDQRPPFRWLIIGPERSGASWHVDPALTSAWNTLLYGRKRWALYPPGRVPLGVTVHVNEEDGDVNIEAPTSLQWWLDFYPLLADEDKPVEFTQMPEETIYVPSGWWHCVLNLETTIAVTQNYVNQNNFEFVCLDMAPGYRHKGICRAGLLAMDEDSFEKVKVNPSSDEIGFSYFDLTRKEKRVKISNHGEDSSNENGTSGALRCYGMQNQEFCYNINFLSMFLDKERDHYNSMWSSSNCIGQREMREWLCKLWAGKPHMRELIWKGACLAINANKWMELASRLCTFHNLPPPSDDEKLPVGTGSNPVYLTADHVVKIYVEGGLEASLHGLGTELEFYSLLSEVNSPLKDHIPGVRASGFIFLDDGSFNIETWDGRGVPQVIAECKLIPENCKGNDFPFGVWSKKQYNCRRAGFSNNESVASDGCVKTWPYIITQRCKGKMFAELRETLSWECALSLASFLGEQLRSLHLLPCPRLTSSVQISEPLLANANMATPIDNSSFPGEWRIFFGNLNKKKKFVSGQLTKWGHPIPSNLIGKVEEYLPNDFMKLLNLSKDENDLCEVSKPCSWIHSDIMDDNVLMEPTMDGSPSAESASEGNSWHPCHILDFSDLSIGDRLCDIIPMHIDIFRGDTDLLRQFLKSYKLPLLRRVASPSVEGDRMFGRLSYHAMCYCIMHEENILGAIFSLWKELRTAESWEEVEQKVWGELNNTRL